MYTCMTRAFKTDPNRDLDFWGKKKKHCQTRIPHDFVPNFTRGGGHWPRKGVWGCAAVMTPFFQATRRSLAYQFTIIAPVLCPQFSNFRNIFNFQPCFGQNFSSQDANFRSLDPSFFKENPLPRPYFWKPVWHTPTKKKIECPPGQFYPQTKILTVTQCSVHQILPPNKIFWGTQFVE